MKPTKDVRTAGKRKLEIRKERVRELATESLHEVVGGGKKEVKTGLCNATTI